MAGKTKTTIHKQRQTQRQIRLSNDDLDNEFLPMTTFHDIGVKYVKQKQDKDKTRAKTRTRMRTKEDKTSKQYTDRTKTRQVKNKNKIKNQGKTRLEDLRDEPQDSF
jgi:hypothetical protein